MLRGIYAAATSMDAASAAHETIARNLAHLSVPGYRRVVTPFAVLEAPRAAGDEDSPAQSLGVKSQDVATDFTAGPIEQTGNPLDVALNGEGFFSIEGPDGPLYTRSGLFHVSPTGELVNVDGLPVLGAQGPMTLPQGVSPSQVQIGADGTIRAGREEVGRLDIVRFDEPQKLISVGDTLFQAPADAGRRPADALVMQGARELSNVSPVSELINLIAAQRQYEAAQRAVTSMDHTMQRRLESN